MKNWKIVIKPTRSGIEIRTEGNAGDRNVAALADYLEEAILKITRKR